VSTPRPARQLTSRDAVLAAIAEYDRIGRDEFLAKYGFRPARDVVLVHENRRYDSKAILGAAYGYQYPEQGPLRASAFNGGVETMTALSRLGFQVERASGEDEGRAERARLSVNHALEQVLAEYGEARRSQAFGRSAEVWKTFEDLGVAFRAMPPVTQRPTLRVQWSAGQGNWARVPWVAFLDARETDTTQHGVYPVLLIRQDLTGAYLTLAQGVTEPKKLGRAEATSFLQGVAARVREQSPQLADAGFALDGNIDLRADPGLGRDYELSTIAHKFYERDAVPPDDQIISDLGALCDAYDRYIETKARNPSALEALAVEFREQRPYPTDHDRNHVAAREDLARALSRENLAAVEADPTTYETLQINRFAGGAYGGPGPQSSIHRGIIDGGDAAKARLARSLRHLLYDADVDVAERLDDVINDPEWKVFGLGESLAVKALAVVRPDEWLPVFPYAGDMGKKRLMQAPALAIEPLDETEFDTAGKRAVESNRRLRERLEPLFSEDPWAQGQFLYWLRDREAAARPPQSGVRALADELLLDAAWLEDTLELLRDKRQIIFYGPPGTGKTFVARRLAEHIAQDPARVEIVQFHPSYAYEDFVEGYRPTTDQSDGHVRFEIKPGPLRRLASDASASESDWCLLIDEINRGNISKIFGELYYLLEYRDEPIRAQYGGLFRLPTNLYLIGTMNTADRSIALLDAALRRRFHFVPFFPDQPPIQGLLRRWLERRRPGMEYVADLVDRVNAQLPDRHLQIGPSHFMTSRLDDQWLRKIWRASILPYLEEQFFDEPQRVEVFALDRLLQNDPASEGANDPERDRPETNTPPGMGADDA
jgi:MoxR-like ATPase